MEHILHALAMVFLLIIDSAFLGACTAPPLLSTQLTCRVVASYVIVPCKYRFLWLRDSTAAAAVNIYTKSPLFWICFPPGIGTFKGPFTISGNGYFAGWIAFAASLKFAYGSNDALRGFADRAANAMKVCPPASPSYSASPLAVTNGNFLCDTRRCWVPRTVESAVGGAKESSLITTLLLRRVPCVCFVWMWVCVGVVLLAGHRRQRPSASPTFCSSV